MEANFAFVSTPVAYVPDVRQAVAKFLFAVVVIAGRAMPPLDEQTNPDC